LNDPIQYRYEIIRPLVLFQDRTATQRAQESDTSGSEYSIELC
jgi:hypothetical protein